MKNISKGKLKTLPIILPPLDIQKKYEQFYLKLRSELLGNSNLVEQAETGFQALMQKAFKGELNLKTKAA